MLLENVRGPLFIHLVNLAPDLVDMSKVLSSCPDVLIYTVLHNNIQGRKSTYRQTESIVV